MKIEDCRTLGFVGVGNMASAIIKGIVGEGYPWDKIWLYDNIADKFEAFAANGAHIAASYKDLLNNCDTMVFAVKPQNMPELLPQLSAVKPEKRLLFISIVAGVSTATISDALGGVPMVRAMPNTPMLIGKGVTALCKNSFANDSDLNYAAEVFAAAGEVILLDESEMNRIISVTSSSPAYVFMFIKAICDGATAQGLDGTALKKTVAAMVSGASELLATSNKTPEELIQMVCSRGGTTEQAVRELDNYRFSEGIISAMEKCTKRADELGAIKS